MVQKFGDVWVPYKHYICENQDSILPAFASPLVWGEFGLGLLFHTAPSCSSWSSLCLSLAIVALSVEQCTFALFLCHCLISRR